MKHLKTYESINNQYSVNDIVICIDNDDWEDTLILNDKYMVTDIYDNKNNHYKHYIKNINDDYYVDYYVDVFNLKTYRETTAVFAHRFVTELQYNTNKYNL